MHSPELNLFLLRGKGEGERGKGKGERGKGKGERGKNKLKIIIKK